MYNGGKEITFHHFEPIMQKKDNARTSKLNGISPAFQSKSHKIVHIALDTSKAGIPPSRLKSDSICFDLYLNSIYLNRHAAKWMKIKFIIT